MTTKCARPTCTRTINTGTGGYCQVHGYSLGTLVPFQPADEAKHIIRNLVAQGMTYYQISKQAGIAQSTISRLVNGTGHRGGAARVRKSTLEALRGVTPRPEYVPSWPYGRRIRSLRAAGKGTQELAEGLGVDAATIRNLTNDAYPTTRTDLADRIRAYYDKHQLDPVEPATPKVAKLRWPLPMDWDDIDDPAEQRGPYTRQQAEQQVTISRADQEAANHLVDVYGSIEDAGRASGAGKGPLSKVVARRPGVTVAAEAVRRIRHHATNHGWVVEMGVAA